MSDVLVYVHLGRDTVVRDVFEVVRTGLSVHAVHTRYRHGLVASRDVTEEDKHKRYIV